MEGIHNGACYPQKPATVFVGFKNQKDANENINSKVSSICIEGRHYRTDQNPGSHANETIVTLLGKDHILSKFVTRPEMSEVRGDSAGFFVNVDFLKNQPLEARLSIGTIVGYTELEFNLNSKREVKGAFLNRMVKGGHLKLSLKQFLEVANAILEAAITLTPIELPEAEKEIPA